jgi:hypothetical protein
MIGFDKGKLIRARSVALLESGKHLPGCGLSVANPVCATGFGKGSSLIASAHASNIALQPTPASQARLSLSVMLRESTG